MSSFTRVPTVPFPLDQTGGLLRGYKPGHKLLQKSGPGHQLLQRTEQGHSQLQRSELGHGQLQRPEPCPHLLQRLLRACQVSLCHHCNQLLREILPGAEQGSAYQAQLSNVPRHHVCYMSRWQPIVHSSLAQPGKSIIKHNKRLAVNKRLAANKHLSCTSLAVNKHLSCTAA